MCLSANEHGALRDELCIEQAGGRARERAERPNRTPAPAPTAIRMLAVLIRLRTVPTHHAPEISCQGTGDPRHIPAARTQGKIIREQYEHGATMQRGVLILTAESSTLFLTVSPIETCKL